jgi:rubrerythrin
MVKWDIGGLENCAPWVRSLSTFFEGRYWTVEEFMAVNRDDIWPDPYTMQFPCGGCGYTLTGPECCPVCYPNPIAA